MYINMEEIKKKDLWLFKMSLVNIYYIYIIIYFTS